MINKKIILSVLFIALVGIGAAGTWANYVDTKDTGTHTIYAGALTINDLAGVSLVTPDYIYPGDSGTLGTFNVQTTGGKAGTLTAKIISPNDNKGNAFLNDLTIHISNAATGQGFDLLTNGAAAPATQISSYIAGGSPQQMTVTYSYAKTVADQVQGGTASFGIEFKLTQN
jgi:hypothetical protein